MKLGRIIRKRLTRMPSPSVWKAVTQTPAGRPRHVVHRAVRRALEDLPDMAVQVAAEGQRTERLDRHHRDAAQRGEGLVVHLVDPLQVLHVDLGAVDDHQLLVRREAHSQ
jgi:hypothetical protein